MGFMTRLMMPTLSYSDDICRRLMCVRYTRVGLSHLESTLLAFCFLIALSSVSALSGINRCFSSFCSFFVVLQLVLVVRSGTV